MYIQGRVIRILDTRTVIINLGREHHINNSSIFHILGEPEVIIDPFTEEELGSVNVVKAKLKASRVDNKFTIATTKWTINTLNLGNIVDLFSSMYQAEEVDQGDLLVDPKDVQPWRAKTETPVRVGDIVEVEVTIPVPKIEVVKEDQASNVKLEQKEEIEKTDTED
jgi:hypothetical protein